MRSALGTAVIHARDALAWRVRNLFGDRRVDRTIETVAHLWRGRLEKPVFIGITGSAGKTTAKELLVGVLRSKRQGIGSPSTLNRPLDVARTILRVRPTDEFCVVELGEDRPDGELGESLALLQPTVGIVTVVGNDHWSSFGSRDAVAMEMRKLITALPPSGTAVLNADDPLVRAMAGSCRGKVILYGTSSDADVRAEDGSSTWPDRLQLTLVRGAERVKLRTQLCGTHWIPSVLGAVGGGVATGMTLEECAGAIANIAPFTGRMQPVTTDDGVTFIRDDWKAPLWTLDACFEFMEAARARRKIIVIGELQDIASQKGTKYAKAAIRAQEIADVTVFVGPWASSALKGRKLENEGAVRAFAQTREAADYINANTRAGDLVLLKGANRRDHLYRIILARSGDVACWRDDCNRFLFCDECPDRRKRSGAVIPVDAPFSAAECTAPLGLRTLERDEQIVVGLGNPEPIHAGTPHNIGYAVADHIAATLGLSWDATPQAWIARGSSRGRPVCVMKIRSAMNGTGRALKQLSESMAFGPMQCILVHDDLSLPLGAVRARLSGGAGGHRGVASILTAFQCDTFRRVKVGVGRAGVKLNGAEYVLTAFDAQGRAAVDPAISAAGARALELVDHRGVSIAS